MTISNMFFFVSWQKGIHNVSGGIKIKFGPNSPRVGHLAKLCSLNPSTYQKVRQMALILEQICKVYLKKTNKNSFDLSHWVILNYIVTKSGWVVPSYNYIYGRVMIVVWFSEMLELSFFNFIIWIFFIEKWLAFALGLLRGVWEGVAMGDMLTDY